MAKFVIHKDKQSVPDKPIVAYRVKKWKTISIVSIGINLALLAYIALTTINHG
jgi:hypothetical protein